MTPNNVNSRVFCDIVGKIDVIGRLTAVYRNPRPKYVTYAQINLPLYEKLGLTKVRTAKIT